MHEVLPALSRSPRRPSQQGNNVVVSAELPSLSRDDVHDREQWPNVPQDPLGSLADRPTTGVKTW